MLIAAGYFNCSIVNNFSFVFFCCTIGCTFIHTVNIVFLIGCRSSRAVDYYFPSVYFIMSANHSISVRRGCIRSFYIIVSVFSIYCNGAYVSCIVCSRIIFCNAISGHIDAISSGSVGKIYFYISVIIRSAGGFYTDYITIFVSRTIELNTRTFIVMSTIIIFYFIRKNSDYVIISFICDSDITNASINSAIASGASYSKRFCTLINFFSFKCGI